MLKQKRIPACILNRKNDAWYLIFEEFISCYFHSFTIYLSYVDGNGLQNDAKSRKGLTESRNT